MAIANKSATLDSAVVAATDVGDTLAHSDKIVDVGASGDGQAIYITAVYGVATTAGVFHFFQTDDWDDDPFTAGDANHMLDFYISLTGDGASNIKIGPITKDLFVAAASAGCDAGAIAVTYEEVGTV